MRRTEWDSNNIGDASVNGWDSSLPSSRESTLGKSGEGAAGQ